MADTPQLTPAQQLAAQYDHGSEADFEPVLTAREALAAPRGGESPSPRRPTPLRDPESGRFVKPERLQRMARNLGVHEDRIQALSADALEDIVETLSAHLAADRQQLPVGPWQDPRQQAPQPSQPAAPESEEVFSLGLKEEDFSPALTGPIEKALAGALKRIAALERQLTEVRTQGVQQQQLSGIALIDQKFNSWKDDRFGQGSIKTMLPNTNEAIARQAVVAAASRLAGPNATWEEIVARLDETRDKLFGQKQPPPPPRQNGHYTEEEWNNGALRRPTQREPQKEPDQRKRATAAVARMQADMANQGIDLEAEEGDNFLP